MRALFAAAVFCVAVSFVSGQEPSASQNEKPKDPHADCPLHKAHAHAEPTSSAMNERGEEGMGFSQTATTHH